MKKIIFLFFVFSFVWIPVLKANIIIDTKEANYVDLQKGDVSIYIVKNILPKTTIEYYGTWSNLKCYKYSGGSASLYQENNFVLGVNEAAVVEIDETESSMGYMLEIDGENKGCVWFINYKDYLPNFSTLELIFDESDCEKIFFITNPDDLPRIPYYSYGNSTPNYIERSAILRYTTKEFIDKDWQVVNKEEVITFPIQKIELPTSLDPKVVFTLSDQIAEFLKINDLSIELYDIPITAIKSHLAVFVTVRNAPNEVERLKESEPTPPITGSAPIDISFKSNPSDENAMIEWEMHREGESIPFITRTDKDHLYTFTSPGKYKVRLFVNNEYCSHRDSVEINVNESLLEVPNVFTPNGDGVNDMFYVTYRSLASFHCWIYNNWGKLAYEWTNPARGWDGRVGGKKAPSGTYFYIIKAKGTDGVNYNLKGDVSIIR